MAVRLFHRTVKGFKVSVDWLLTDNDSMTRANMKHTGPLKKDKGKLPHDVFEQTRTLTNPSHQNKSLSKKLFGMIGKNNGRMLGHAERAKRNHAYAQSQYRHEDVKSFTKQIYAVFLHIMNMHMFCDTTWCSFAHQTTENHCPWLPFCML